MGEMVQKAFSAKAGLESEILTLEWFSVEDSFLRFGFACHFLSQLETAKSNPIITQSYAFSRACIRLHGSNSD